MEGMLPYTPKFEFKASGSYLLPRIDVDLGMRFRLHSGRPIWLLESYPQHTQWADPPGGVIDPGGVHNIVGVSQPEYLPTQAILDLRLEKAIKLGGSKQLHLAVDGFNVFNTDAVSNVDYQFEYGKVTGIAASRRFRGTIRFEF